MNKEYDHNQHSVYLLYYHLIMEKPTQSDEDGDLRPRKGDIRKNCVGIWNHTGRGDSLALCNVQLDQ